MQGRALLRAALLLAAVTLALPGCSTPPATGFAMVAYPFGAAESVATGLPRCGGAAGIGAVGLVHDGESLFVSDWCNATTYRYPVGATAPWTAGASAVNGLTNGLAFSGGAYFGIAGHHQTLVEPGVYQFDPLTLQLLRPIAPALCRDMRGLAADPTTGTLVATGDCGLWRIEDLDAPLATVTQLVESANLDGIGVTDDGRLWVVDVAGQSVCHYDAKGKLLTSWRIIDVPIGVAVAPPSAAPAVRGKVFANNTNGFVTMLDPQRDGEATIVASGGSRGDLAVFGPDGALYVTQPGEVVRFGYAEGPGPPRTYPGPRQVPYSLLLACALFAVTWAIIAIAPRALRRRARAPGATNRQLED